MRPQFRINAWYLLFLLTGLVACGSNAERDSDIELAGTVFSVSCERGWEDCYQEAQRRCGGRFDEIDRGAQERMLSDHQRPKDGPGVSETTYRSITVRCE